MKRNSSQENEREADVSNGNTEVPNGMNSQRLAEKLEKIGQVDIEAVDQYAIEDAENVVESDEEMDNIEEKP